MDDRNEALKARCLECANAILVMGEEGTTKEAQLAQLILSDPSTYERISWLDHTLRRCQTLRFLCRRLFLFAKQKSVM